MQRDANAFKSGAVTLRGDAAYGDQHIGLRIVGGGAPTGNCIGNDGEARCLADLSLKVTADVHDLTSLQIPFLHINRIQKESPPAAKDAAIAIVQSVDRGVELIVAANGRQQKFAGLQLMLRDWTNGKLRLAGACLENALLRGIRQIEKSLTGKSRVEVLESRNDLGN